MIKPVEDFNFMFQRGGRRIKAINDFYVQNIPVGEYIVENGDTTRKAYYAFVNVTRREPFKGKVKVMMRMNRIFLIRL